jgi:hypothetical protein
LCRRCGDDGVPGLDHVSQGLADEESNPGSPALPAGPRASRRTWPGRSSRIVRTFRHRSWRRRPRWRPARRRRAPFGSRVGPALDRPGSPGCHRQPTRDRRAPWTAPRLRRSCSAMPSPGRAATAPRDFRQNRPSAQESARRAEPGRLPASSISSPWCQPTRPVCGDRVPRVEIPWINGVTTEQSLRSRNAADPGCVLPLTLRAG